MDFLSEIQSLDRGQTKKEIFRLIERLYPICRSITGNGLRETLSILSEVVPLAIHEVRSGEQANDWTVPPEWNIKDAWIKNSKGEKIVRFSDTNLHVLNYSEPVNKKVSLAELKKHLFTLPDKPGWVPYRTSYHNRNWGFCMSHKQFEQLEDETYQVFINSSLGPGSLTYGEFFVKGETGDEVLISTHICHPSLCNDNLSGIAVAAFAAAFLQKLKPKYSFRFLFVPATIGPITWLSRNEDKLKNIKYGLVLALLGDTGKFHYKKSRQADAEINFVVENVLRNKIADYKILNFSPYGYDERQYCSPGYNLPVGRLTRTPNGEYPEYHTSADNLDFVKGDKLVESLELLLHIFNTMENNASCLNLKPKGEPQLGKRGLFRSISGQGDVQEYQMALLWVLNLSDGEHSLLDISNEAAIDFSIIKQAAIALEKAKLLKQLD